MSKVDDPKYTGQKLKLVGTRVMRPDGVDKVTGRAKYGADMNAPGQLVGVVLRSPHAHAEIKSINTSKAETDSSQIMKSGASASARAIQMRCRWPPENS